MEQLIRSATIFGGLSDEQLEKILSMARTETFAKGEVIFRQGDTASDMYIIGQGRVSIVMRAEDSDVTVPLATFGPGDCFGEMAIIEVAPHIATARALEDTELVCLSISALYRLYEEDPRTFAHVILNAARELSRRLDETDRKLVHFFASRPKAIP